MPRPGPRDPSKLCAASNTRPSWDPPARRGRCHECGREVGMIGPRQAVPRMSVHYRPEAL